MRKILQEGKEQINLIEFWETASSSYGETVLGGSLYQRHKAAHQKHSGTLGNNDNQDCNITHMKIPEGTEKERNNKSKLGSWKAGLESASGTELKYAELKY